MLELRDIRKSYPTPSGRIEVLRGTFLRVSVGEFVALRGPSGSGKTTLLLTAGGLLKPDGGTVTLLGQPVYGRSTEGAAIFRARNVGLVFQQFHLVPYLTVLQNVLCPSLAIHVSDAPARARELLTSVGLGDRFAHTPAQLSTGERQRVALARALLPGPTFILADEPTGNLDEVSAAIVIDQLEEFAHGGGAVLVVTHDPAVVGRASRVVKMADLNAGGALAEGRP